VVQTVVVPAMAKTRGANDANVLSQVNGAPAASRLEIVVVVTQIFRRRLRNHLFCRIHNLCHLLL
jgi:hypothetical protein